MLHSTSSTTPFSLVAYKPASTHLDSPLHGSIPILRGAVNLSVLVVPRLQLPVHHGRSASICCRPYAFFPIHLTHCTYCQFIWPPAADSRLMHTSLHLKNRVSITSVHSATCVLTSHWTVPRTLSGCCLNYTNSTLMGISIKNISRLQRLKSTLAPVVTCQWGCISISKTLQELHWLPIKWHIDYKVATLTYKFLESGEPTYLRSRITSKIFRRAYDQPMTGNSNCVHPIRKLDDAPFIAAPAIWNCLPYVLRAAPSV